MTRWSKVAISGLWICAAAAASAAEEPQPNPLQLRSWAAACAACHGTGGVALPGMSTLAGVPAEVLLQKLMDFKAGKTPSATLMPQLAKGYSDVQLQALAGYFATPAK